MNVEMVRALLGWCTLINFGLMMFSFLMLMLVGDRAIKLHARLFRLEEAAVRQAHFQFFSNYKVLVIVFNLVPYIALRIMA